MMDSKLQLFQNEEFGRLEVLMLDGKPYFPASACAQVLGYKKPNDAVHAHCRATVKHSTPISGKMQDINYIPEGDLYRLIIRSKLPTAERFEKWVFDEVLPTIREHGAYITEDAIIKVLESPSYAMKLFHAAAAAKIKNTELEEKLSELAPKASYCDMVLACTNVVPISVIAKDYGMSAASFNQLLHGLGIQYKSGKTWLLYQRHAGKGYTRSRTYYVNDYTAVMHTYWTQRGRLFLYERLKECGLLPLMEAWSDVSGV